MMPTTKRTRASSKAGAIAFAAAVAPKIAPPGKDAVQDIEDLMRLRAQRMPRGSHGDGFHEFEADEVSSIRSRLLEWYDEHQRVLPWRRPSSASSVGVDARPDNGDDENRPYRVWVSEIMLQQTQVSKVIGYFERWIARWPTAAALASATLEEVNEVWSGLGYYSRARRLHEGARRITEELGGRFPSDAETLMKEISGVGRYTAGAVASIAFGERVPVVDGNVIRVLSRLRSIGADPKAAAVVEKMWELAGALVDPSRPGDFNQSIMELGATVCTPQTPKCGECPVRRHCRALAESDDVFVPVASNKPPRKAARTSEPATQCDLCHESLAGATASPPTRLSVLAYPIKVAKKKAREESFAVAVAIARSSPAPLYLIVKRPDKGLLGGLWEFPNRQLASAVCDDGDDEAVQLVPAQARESDAVETIRSLAVRASDLSVSTFYAGAVSHVFSHVKHTYEVYLCTVEEAFATSEGAEVMRWMSEDQLSSAALSTAMRKVLDCALKGAASESPGKPAPKKQAGHRSKGQSAISAFFKAK